MIGASLEGAALPCPSAKSPESPSLHLRTSQRCCPWNVGAPVTEKRGCRQSRIATFYMLHVRPSATSKERLSGRGQVVSSPLPLAPAAAASCSLGQLANSKTLPLTGEIWTKKTRSPLSTS